jgi:transposase
MTRSLIGTGPMILNTTISDPENDGGNKKYCVISQPSPSQPERILGSRVEKLDDQLSLRACLKSRMRGHVIVGVMTISTDVDKLYDTDLTDAAWALIAPMLPAARPGGRPRKINIRAVLNAIFYLLRTGCQWRLLPREFPGWSTVYHYFRAWKNAGVWTSIQRSMYQQARGQAGRAACPSVVIMDGQSVKTTERRRHSRIRCAQARERP